MKSRAARGVTLLEVMATMAVMLLGVAAAMTVVSQTAQSNRRTLTANQAQVIAERQLETILARGCEGTKNCSNLDNQSFTVYQTAEGVLRTTAPTIPGLVVRAYDVDIDVDNSAQVGTAEGSKWGEPSISRVLAGVSKGTLVNVRVTVSWTEPGIREGRQAVVLQTRLAP
ncbi:type IV pilus modification PilV family protein [Corallococcus exiguus]|uniref:type IV pilus modification PilV family protein n=1 Tax=Corallococcus exiguus TaxID=83462 RepID=UPI00149483C3|nr:prepilin-type N-terminal cleavage/methylation domain-containing protein [Corallococcus exiguus]NPD22381.1 prepilin-type N-terminal cleavage/methylation domain-containing protein [Corallococcus exiguus]NRD43441.1 prepilin-type N-terminal cleavage/methylation domain-containing protein [Corallococcus exiguus]